MENHNIEPNFVDYQGFSTWRENWRKRYAVQSKKNQKCKLNTKHWMRMLQERERNNERDLYNPVWNNIYIATALYRENQKKARELMEELEIAKMRCRQIKSMKNSVREQSTLFPLEIEGKNIDFHFNKISLEFPFMPAWVVKVKGKSWYVDSIDAQVPFTTKLKENGSTRGLLRFKTGRLCISKEGIASIV